MSEYIVDGSATLSKREKAFPAGSWSVVKGGYGPFVETGSRTYLDLVSALGALTVGHAHPHVVEAVTSQLQRGSLFSWPSELEGQVAERLCGLIPSAEQVKFCRSGSEACAAAIMVARAARPASSLGTILTFENHYHGWTSDTTVRTPVHPGRPEWMRLGITQLPENATAAQVREHLRSVPKHAAMLCEPERLPHLEEIVRVCREHDLLVIYDETLSGGRLALAGMQALVKEQPNLSIYGKAFGGGLPFAFVCGSRDVMKHAWMVSGTFSGDTLGLAACNAMLDLYESDYVIEDLHARGAVLKRGFEVVQEVFPQLEMTIHGRDPRFWITFGPHINRRELMSKYVHGMHLRGYLAHQAVTFASAAMTPQQAMGAQGAIVDTWGRIMEGKIQLPETAYYADSVR